VATAGLSFLRSLGGVIGSTVIGAVYANRVDVLIPRYVGAAEMASIPDTSALQGRPSVIRGLAEPVRSQVIHAFADAITIAVRFAIPSLLIAFVVFCFIPRVPLRDTFDDAPTPVGHE
jgi:hypothetical protein